MLWNLGRESEEREENRRLRGRRHAPRDPTAGHRPTYMSAPFATGAEEQRSLQEASTYPGLTAKQQKGFDGVAGKDDLALPYDLQREGPIPNSNGQNGYSSYSPSRAHQYASQNGNGDSAEHERGEYMRGNDRHDYMAPIDNHVDYTRYRDDDIDYMQEDGNEKYSGAEVPHDKYPLSKEDYNGYAKPRVSFDDYDYSKGQFVDYTKPRGDYEEGMQANNEQDYARHANECNYLMEAKNGYANCGPNKHEHIEQAVPNGHVKSEVSSVPAAGLKTSRLSRGLNIFSWNTDAPTVQPPRVMHDRDNFELQRLHPSDAQVDRDKEVRDKFEGNKSSCFLRFSENAKSHPDRHRGAPLVNPHVIPAATGTTEYQPRFGRRQSGSANSSNKEQGIAGFAGMGARGSERPYRVRKNPSQQSNIF